MGDSEIILSSHSHIDEIADFLDLASFNRIVNKLTDYAEILTEGKIAGIVNFNYTLNSTQTNQIIELLLGIQSISRIYTLALKGSRDLESEYVSNIFSDVTAPETISSYLSLRNLLENRLNHQTQQYNMNMAKSNTTMAMPLNELRGHVKTYMDLSSNKVTVSNKAQHGIIAASLHDAYIILLNRPEYWNDKTYMKYFFNEDDPGRHDTLIITRETRLSLINIKKSIEDIKERFSRLIETKLDQEKEHQQERLAQQNEAALQEERATDIRSKAITDRMLMTPFGKQYGGKIDSIMDEIFSSSDTADDHRLEAHIRQKMTALYDHHRQSADLAGYAGESAEIVEYLLSQDYSIKTMTEKLIYTGRKDAFTKYFSDAERLRVEDFLNSVFTVYFDMKFEPIFRIIKSLDLKKFACAYIIKRIYLTRGEGITNFCFYFIRTISKIGGIKLQ